MKPLAAVLSVLLWANVAAAATPVLRDSFTNGSGRIAPAVVVVPQLEGDLGARPEDPGYDASELRHHVVLSPYAIGRTEITNSEFATFLSDAGNQSDDGNPWFDPSVTGQIIATANGFAPVAGAENKPAAGMTWTAARAYCRWLSKMTGAAYELPTGAQWEMAARAGTTTAWWWGDADDPARYRSIAGERVGASDAASYAPNPWGIYDTAGNVWEWTLDCYAADSVLMLPARDPRLVDDRCHTPEIRGGSFRDGGHYSRPSYRSNAWWTTTADVLGFRVARTIDAPRAAAAHARALQLVWRRSGKPASLLATVNAGNSSPVVVAANGTIALPADAGVKLQLVDPVSGLVLFDGTAPAASPLRLVEPVRLRGTLAGVPAGSVARVRIGFGPRAAAMERWLRATGSQAPRDARMTASHGIALPPSPLAWRDATIDEQSFDGGWILATDAPQIAAFDSAGRVVVTDVALPDVIEAHAVLDAGTLTLQMSNAIDIDAPLPASELALPLLIGVTKIDIDAAAKAEAGRLLSALDQIEPRLFALLVLDHGLTLSYTGKAHLRPLPRFTSMTLLVHEPFDASGVEREVVMTAGVPAAVHLELGGSGVFRSTAPAKFTGRVTARGVPVAGATVVVSEYPKRRETRTDTAGRFSVDGIRTDRTVSVLVDASGSPAVAPGAVHIFRDVAAAADAELAWPFPAAVPAIHTGGTVPLPALTNGCDVTTNDPQYGSETWLATRDKDVIDDAFSVVAYDPKEQKARITTCAASQNWAFWLAPTPFMVFAGPGVGGGNVSTNCPPTCASQCFGYDVVMKAIVDPRKIELQFNNSSGFAANNVQILFSPPGPFACCWDPTPKITDKDGKIVICPINTNPIHVFYEGQWGTTDCDVDLTKTTIVTLGAACK